MQSRKDLRGRAVTLYFIAIIALLFSWMFWSLMVQRLPVPASFLGNSLSQSAPQESVENVHSSATEDFTLWGSHRGDMQDGRGKTSTEETQDGVPTTLELAEWELAEAYTINIPSLGISAPVYLPSLRYWNRQNWDLLEQQMQIGLLAGAVAYPHSVAAGSRGTLIIAGHSSPPSTLVAHSPYGAIFARLPELTEGSIISILKDGAYVDYTVMSAGVVASSDTSMLTQQQDTSLIKLITCYPIGTTKDRWVVTAKRTHAG